MATSHHAIKRLEHLLIVDDSRIDQEILTSVLEELNFINEIHCVDDGVEALHFLRNQEGYKGAPTPDLIILDRSMPRRDGMSLLEALNEDPKLNPIPTAFYTTSDDTEERVRRHNLRAGLFLTKAMDLKGQRQAARRLYAYWEGLSGGGGS